MKHNGCGICVCQEWLEFTSFREWSLSHGYINNLTLDRKDNDGNYEPSNCRWATASEQQNNKHNTIYVKIDDTSDTLVGWSKRTGLKLRMLQDRYHRGWKDARLIQPVIRKAGDNNG